MAKGQNAKKEVKKKPSKTKKEKREDKKSKKASKKQSSIKLHANLFLALLAVWFKFNKLS